jgi:hypothetical protein
MTTWATVNRTITAAITASAVSAGLAFPSASVAKRPSTRSVTDKVENRFLAQTGQGLDHAESSRYGTSSWDCHVFTRQDALRLAAAIGGSRSPGVTISDLQDNGYSHRCSVRYSRGRVVIGRFVHHRYPY